MGDPFFNKRLSVSSFYRVILACLAMSAGPLLAYAANPPLFSTQQIYVNNPSNGAS